MTTAKRKMENSATFAATEHEVLQNTGGGFSGNRLAEVIHDMSVEHFRKFDESKPKQTIDTEAEKKINALFEKHSKETEGF